jgi:glucose-6-phosphate 1-epimerase
VVTPLARAEVYLQGAHVTAYTPRERAPLLFLSRASRFAAGAPIRGGVRTYLAVDDVERIHVTGLEGATFLDETDGFARKREGTGPLVLRGDTDRVYDDTRATCVVWDPSARRRVEIVKTGSDATVVWNPGPVQARAFPDLGADEWQTFVCVESGNVGRRAVTVATGTSHRLSVSLRSEPWETA